MKSIQPLDPEALKKHMEEQGGLSPTMATVDTASVYKSPDATTLRRPDVPATPAQAPSSTRLTPPAPTEPEPSGRVAGRTTNLKCFTAALALYHLCVVGMLVYFLYPLLTHVSLIAIRSYLGAILASTVLPLLAALYLLFTKSMIAARVILILIILQFAYTIFDAFNTYGGFGPIIKITILSDEVTITLSCILAIWAVFTLRSLNKLDD